MANTPPTQSNRTMNSNLWTDALAALRATMPDAPETPEAAEQAPAETAKAPKLTATLFYESKGRGGKPATIITGLDALGDDALQALASELKKALATGGSCRGGEILLQGDRRPQVRKLLADRGFRVKG